MAKAYVIGTEGVMQWYDRNSESPYYSVWVGKQLMFSWNKEDQDEARQKLEEDLTAFENNGVNDIFMIRLHPVPKVANDVIITNNTPYYASLNFRPANSPEGIFKGIGSDPRLEAPVYSLMREMQETNKAILSKLNAQELEDEEEDKATGLMGFIEKPEVQTMIMGLLGNILNKNKPGAIAGTITQEDLQLLQQLMNKGITTEHLRKLVAMDQNKIQSLLMML